MKVTFESVFNKETEVIIKGEIGNAQVDALLEFVKSISAGGVKKLVLFKDDEQFLIDPEEIVYVEVEDSTVKVVTQYDTYFSKKKLYELKEMLKNESFAQINKGTLVNIDFIKSVSAEFSGNYSLRLKTGKEILTISRKYFKEFKSKL